MCLSVAICGVICSCALFFAERILRATAPSQEVKEVALRAWPGLVWSVFAYALAFTMVGLLRGAGRQVTSAVAFGVSYWCIGLPFAWYYGVRLGGGLIGIWFGNALALGLAFVATAVSFFFFVDWEALLDAGGVDG